MNQAQGSEPRGRSNWLKPLSGAVALVAAAILVALVAVALLLRQDGGQTGAASSAAQADATHAAAPRPSDTEPTASLPTEAEPSHAASPWASQTPLPPPTDTPIPAPTGVPTKATTRSPSHTPTPMLSPVSTAARTTAPSLFQSLAPSPSPTPEPLLAPPYLGETTPSSAVISWATLDPGTSEVRYGPDADLGWVAAASSTIYDGKHWHWATVTGLAAGTTYHYRVYTAGQDLTPWPEVTFTTAPDPSSTAFAFATLGDSRPWKQSDSPSEGALAVAARLAEQDVDLVVHTGDIVHSGGECSGEDSGWNQYLRGYLDLYRASAGHIPFYPAPGNHEFNGGTCGRQSYGEVFTLPTNAPAGAQEAYYSFDWANAHFVALDTTQQYRPGSAQYEWLVQDLGTTAKPWIFVFTHYPAYSSGHHGSTAPLVEHLVPVFEAHGVDMVFAGHDHAYERTCPVQASSCTTPEAGGVVYFVTGGGGAAPYAVRGNWFTAQAASIYHLLRVEVDGCRLALEAIDAAGTVYDSYHLDRCAQELGSGSG